RSETPGSLERGRAGPVAPGGISGHVLEHAPQRADVLDRDAEAVDALLDQVVAGARRLRGDERQARAGGLLHRHAPGLGAGRHDEAVRGAVPAVQILGRNVAEQASGRARERPDEGRIGAVADEDQLTRHPVEGAREDIHALLAREAADAEEHAAVKAALGPELVSTARRRGGLDGVRRDRDLLAGNPEGLYVLGRG